MKKQEDKIFFPDPENNIFTEGVDYSTVGETSIWGEGDDVSVEYLRSISSDQFKIWLDLGAGDGRYLPYTLYLAKYLFAADIDFYALNKLREKSPENKNLIPIVFDITKPFPIRNKSIDVVFCMGTLHYFSADVLKKILSEIDRVLQNGGRIILDFAYNIERRLGNTIYDREGVADYKYFPYDDVFKCVFDKYQIKRIIFSEFEDDLTDTHGYIQRGSFVLFVADKVV